MRKTVAMASMLALMGSLPAPAQDAPRTLNYTATDAEFLNPERGFMRFTDLTNPFSYDDIRNDGQTIVYGRVLASNFRDRAFTPSFLNQIQAGFDAARTHGIKVKFRVQYNDDGGADAPKSVILGHIEQLRPLWEANKDVLFHMDAGFIGGWGEWHSSQNGLDTPANRAEILGAILDALPVDRTVGIRTPHFKREIYGGSQASDSAVITAANAFDGSDLSRVGHLNDCLLSSNTDLGTYINPGGQWPVSRELEYIGGESLFVPHGGETCARHPRNDAAAAIAEMTTLHTDYLNLDYHPDVIQHWRDADAFDEIQRRLGYRFELDTATLPTAVRPGGLMPLEFTIDNVGFGELFNPRDVEIVLTNNATGESRSAGLAVDPRWWAGGTTATVATQLVTPSDLAEGSYTVGLWMPDADASLRDDPRYAIRLANVGLWDGATGVNVLTRQFVVDSQAAGLIFQAGAFAEVTDPAALALAGDFNLDGAVDAADYTVWRDSPLGELTAADYNLWASNYGATLPMPTTAVPEPAAAGLAAIAGLVGLIRGRR